MTQVCARRPFLDDEAVAVVPAGGSGSRMGIRQPKQYLTVGGAPILVLTLRALARCASLHGLIVAAPADRVTATRDLLRRFRVPRVLEVVPGGAERQDSVREGLQAAPPTRDGSSCTTR
jgi:2-C-methyl-D-erythritol 4-phosphate cytidylyltransferase